MTRRNFIGTTAAAISFAAFPFARSNVGGKHIETIPAAPSGPLPPGYVELDAIYFNGSKRSIDTGVIPSAGTDIYCLAELGVVSGIHVLMGCGGGAWIGHQSSLTVTSNSGTTGLNVSLGELNEYAIVNGYISVNGTISSRPTTIIGSTITIGYGSIARLSSSYGWVGNLGRFWAIRDGEIIADLIPCEHDGQQGFYDIVNKVFKS